MSKLDIQHPRLLCVATEPPIPAPNCGPVASRAELHAGNELLRETCTSQCRWISGGSSATGPCAPKKRPVIRDYSVDTVNRSCSLEFKMPINISFCANNKNKYNFMADHFFAGQPLTINFGWVRRSRMSWVSWMAVLRSQGAKRQRKGSINLNRLP